MDISEEQLKKEFQKDFFNPLYLAKFKISGKPSEISAIIPTYNRCPFDKKSPDYFYNPLYICVKALLLQKSPLKEIIVVDDCSNDNTKEVVEELKKEAYSTKGIEIKYFKNAERKGSSISRNIGAKNAGGKYLFFLDDDCVPTPYLTFISDIVIKHLEKDKNFAVLVLPVYNRASYPSKAIKIEDLTKTFFKRGTASASFNSIPEEYLLNKNIFFNNNLKIFLPIKVYQTWGHFIIDRSKYLDVGGFPEFATWPNKAGEEQEFACRLIENAYSLYYLPGTKAASFHGVYGAKLGGFSGIDWLLKLTNGKFSLAKFSRICESGKSSGNRVNVRDYCYSRIIAVFSIIYKRNMKEAINYAKLSYKEFVVEKKKSWFSMHPNETIKSREEREKIWYKAIDDGLKLLLKTEEKKIEKLNHFITSLKVRGRIEAEEKENKLKELLQMIYNE
ncbi:glycosyltransferase family 2 protein [Candidatus Pacearchaeota archaeon]|nr:glycosyltransferase family 2 protein [Candidatus Pacearchaeota archaeon]